MAIEFIGAYSGQSMPGGVVDYQEGDLLILTGHTFGNSGPAPEAEIPEGFTLLNNELATNPETGASRRLTTAYAYASGPPSTFSMMPANRLGLSVYRGVSHIVKKPALITSNSEYLHYQEVPLTVNDGSSWVVRVGLFITLLALGGPLPSTPSDYTLRHSSSVFLLTDTGHGVDSTQPAESFGPAAWSPTIAQAYELVGDKSANSGQVKIYTGESHVPKPVKVWTGSEWEIKPLKYYDGTSWLTTNY